MSSTSSCSVSHSKTLTPPFPWSHIANSPLDDVDFISYFFTMYLRLLLYVCFTATKAQICTCIHPLYQPNKFPFLFPESNGEKLTWFTWPKRSTLAGSLKLSDPWFCSHFLPFCHFAHPPSLISPDSSATPLCACSSFSVDWSLPLACVSSCFNLTLILPLWGNSPFFLLPSLAIFSF